MASTAEIYSLPESQTRDLPRCTDQMLISALREHRASELDAAHHRWQDINAFITKIDQNQGWCLFRQTISSILMKAAGTWSVKKIVSVPNTSRGNSPDSTKFVGTKTTMEFKPADGSKAVVGMTRYNLLTTREDGDGLDLQEDLALCHIFPLEGKAKGTRNRNGKRSRSEYALDPCNGVTNAEMEVLKIIESEIDSTKFPPLAVVDGSLNVQDLFFADPSKNEASKFWQSFTKIYTKNPKLMYAACNHCDTMLKLKGGPSCGTGSLRHHSDSCRCKPKQQQLPGNSSSMPILPIGLQSIME